MRHALCQTLMGVWLFSWSTAASAQPFAIDWYSMDGGGGVSSGGSFTVSGTLGQPDGARVTGGGFALEGGFQSAFVAVQSIGAPRLEILRVGNNVEITWADTGAAEFFLQRSFSLGPAASWVDEDVDPSLVDGVNRVTLSLVPGFHFFRLRKP